MKTTISININTDNLESYHDSYLASLWHVAQINPVDGFKSHEPGELAEKIGREIIRRFLVSTPPPLWDQQGRHFASGHRS
jgi:hypothetical protein